MTRRRGSGPAAAPQKAAIAMAPPILNPRTRSSLVAPDDSGSRPKPIRVAQGREAWRAGTLHRCNLNPHRRPRQERGNGMADAMIAD